jgi:hypothetical protein
MSGVARTNRPGGTAQATRQQLDELDALLQRMLDLPVTKPEPEPAEADYAPPRPARPEPTRPPAPPRQAAPPRRAYPPSYMVVETSTPPLRPPPDEPAREAALDPRRVERPTAVPQEEVFGDYRTAEPPPEVEPGGDWVPLRSSWQPSAQTWKPLAETWQQSRATPPPPVIPPEPPRAWVPPPEQAAPPVVIRPAGPHTVGEPVIPPPSDATPSEPETSTPLLLLPAVWFNQAFDACLAPLGPVGRWLQGRAGRGLLGTVGLLALAGAIALAAADGIGWTR